MRPWPLKWRVGLFVAAMLLIVIAVISGVAYWDVRKAFIRDLDDMLAIRAQALAATVGSQEPMEDLLVEARALMGSKDSPRGSVYRVWEQNAEGLEELLASHAAAKWPLDWTPASAIAPRMGGTVTFDAMRGDRPYRVLWICRPDPEGQSDRALNIVVAGYRGHVDHEMGEFLRMLLILGGSIVGASIVATIVIVRWGLQPIVRLTRQMDTISAGSLEGQAPDSPATPVELRPFVRAMGQMLQRLSEAMRQQRNFVAYASHELRTPLAVAKSTLQVAQSQRRSAQEYALAIERATEDLERLERLAEQLLVLARLEGPTDESAWQPVSLQDLIGDLCEQYLPLAARTGGTIRWQTLPGLVRGDADQLERLVSNLIDNAIKHGPERGEVVVSMHQEDPGHVCIRVHDAGGAIPEAAIGRLFDPFFRVSGARDRATGGAGLGLAMVREIAHRHRGQVTVQSAPQTGTEFVVALPCLPGRGELPIADCRLSI